MKGTINHLRGITITGVGVGDTQQFHAGSSEDYFSQVDKALTSLGASTAKEGVLEDMCASISNLGEIINIVATNSAMTYSQKARLIDQISSVRQSLKRKVARHQGLF